MYTCLITKQIVFQVLGIFHFEGAARGRGWEQGLENDLFVL